MDATRIGLDFGGVIGGGGAPGTSFNEAGEDTTMFGEHFLKTPAVSGAADAVKKLVDALGCANVLIVSKAGPDMEKKTRAWLRANFSETGLGLAENLHFVRRREDKGGVATALGLTHFVDDTASCLAALPDELPTSRRYLFVDGEKQVAKPQSKAARAAAYRAAMQESDGSAAQQQDYVRVEGWGQLMECLAESIAALR